MKAEVQENSFSPVQITLESQFEVDLLWALLAMSYAEQEEHLNYHFDLLFDRKKASDMFESIDSLKVISKRKP